MIRKETRDLMLRHGFPEAAFAEMDKPTHTQEWSVLAERRTAANKAYNKISRIEIRGDDARAETEREAQAEAEALLGEYAGAVTREFNARELVGTRAPRNLKSGRVMLGAETNNHLMFRNLETGREVRAYRHNETLAPDYREHGEPRLLTFGSFVAGVVSGRWASSDHEREARALSVGSVGAGGYLVPAPLAAQWIDRARNMAAVLRAGAITVPMDSNTLDIARLATGVTPEWKSENSAFTASSPTFERVRLTAKTLGALVTMSGELAMDAPNIDEVLETELTKALALELDRASLVGLGSGSEPTGVYYASGIGSITLGVPIANYDFVSRAVQEVREANHEPNAMIAHPRTYGELDRLKEATTLAPLMPPRSYQDLTHFPSAQVPVNMDPAGSPATQTAAFVAKWNELLIGMRMNSVLLEVSRDATVGSDTAFSKYQVHVRAILRCDVQLARAAAFCVVKDIEETL